MNIRMRLRNNKRMRLLNNIRMRLRNKKDTVSQHKEQPMQHKEAAP
jgi:hypothetical protein